MTVHALPPPGPPRDAVRERFALEQQLYRIQLRLQQLQRTYAEQTRQPATTWPLIDRRHHERRRRP